jgi:hypothetical protein
MQRESHDGVKEASARAPMTKVRVQRGQKPDLDEATLQIAKRILSTPPKPHSAIKPHSAMKIGKRKAKAKIVQAANSER